MKQTNRLILACASVLSLLALSACKGNVLDFRNAQVINGKVYAGNANEPFSGKLTNIQDRLLLLERPGFWSSGKLASPVLAESMPSAERNAQAVLYGTGPSLLLPGTLCDVQISDGLPDGKAVCKEQQSDVVRIEASFNKGILDGSFEISGGQGGGRLMEITFRNGQPDGKQEIYSWTNHKLIHTFQWSNGVPSGTEEAFDSDTGALVKQATFVGGKYEGELVHYAPDGKQITVRATYANDKLNGPFKAWDTSGALIADTIYADGLEVGVDGSRVDDCVQSWREAEEKKQLYAQQAKGVISGTPPTTPEQRSAWAATCRAGHHPDPSEVASAAQAAQNAEAAINRCVAAKKETYRRSHGIVDATEAQSWEFRKQCYAEAQSSSAATTHAPQATTANATNTSNDDICMSIWTAAYHREKGGDAMVSADQIDEWRSWCKEGKRPS